MKKMHKLGSHRVDDAAARVAEISELFVSIRLTLAQMREDIATSDAQPHRTIITKLSEIQSTHLKVLAAEEAFHAQQDATGAIDTIDTDAIRADIGRALARIRATLDAGEVPKQSD